jgi:phage repressor protein C with HTH and peptisase S24 domain
MEINCRLKLIREYHNESQAKFAIRFDLPQSTYAQYEKGGRSIPDDLKQQLAELGVDMNWLITGQGDMFASPGAATGESTQEPVATFITPRGGSVPVKSTDDFALVPLIQQRLSAGPGQEYLSEDTIRRMVPIPNILINGYKLDDIGAAEVRGDSMTGLMLFDGDVAFFAKKVVSQDGVYVINVDGEVYIKRLSFDPFDSSVTIISENDRYAQRTVSSDRVVVLGKVIGWFHKHPY